jgi:hypothetical protein
MKLTTAQNKLNKYLDKVQANRFEEENNIKQTENQLDKKDTIMKNMFNRFLITALKLTEKEYYSLEEVGQLCFSYEDVLEESEYLNN